MQINMPKHVDDLPQVLWWEADEVAIAISIFGIGLLTHYMMTSLIVMVIVMRLASRMKSAALNGAAFQVMCSSGLVQLNNEFPDLLEKELFV